MKQSETKAIMSRALEHIKSVPYQVSLRWVFYRLYQEGLYKDKKDYQKKFKGLAARWRKTWKNGWFPSIIKDDTRDIFFYGSGYADKEEWIENLQCDLDKWDSQDYVTMVLFEAAAMLDQFKYYTKNLPLAPFSGDPSIPLKWKIAKAVEELSNKYDKPVILLYFGDCDEKGNKIDESALKDIRAWCKVPFTFKRCGLNLEQAEELKLPISIKSAGYQWEALTDEQAKEIILSSLEPYQDVERYKPIEEKEEEITKQVKGALKGALS